MINRTALHRSTERHTGSNTAVRFHIMANLEGILRHWIVCIHIQHVLAAGIAAVRLTRVLSKLDRLYSWPVFDNNIQNALVSTI